MTNADRIRNMSNWELAEFIYNVSNGEVKITTCRNVCDDCSCSDAYCVSGISEWLNEQCEEEEK